MAMSNPHDRYFREVFSDPVVVQDFLRNYLPAPVLAALDEHAQPADIERVLKERPAQGYQNVDEFLNAAQLTPDAPTKALLSTDSQYFLLQVEVRLGDGRAVLSSTLFRDENRVRVLRRSFGNPD